VTKFFDARKPRKPFMPQNNFLQETKDVNIQGIKATLRNQFSTGINTPVAGKKVPLSQRKKKKEDGRERTYQTDQRGKDCSPNSAMRLGWRSNVKLLQSIVEHPEKKDEGEISEYP